MALKKKKMNLILTMAGRYSRFVNEGYRMPKYLLPWGSKTLLSEIITELDKDHVFRNIFLIANKRDEIYMPHVRQILKSLGKPVENLILISDTSGQAETANNAIINIQNNHGKLIGPIIFHNIDTILYKRDLSGLQNILSKYSAYIDVFKSSNHSYSYVLTENKIAKSIAEKIVISDKATSGLYGFSNTDKFFEFYTKEDIYISNLYKKMIQRKEQIIVSDMHDENDTIVLGTPSEYLTAAYILDL
jgi:NDP-sugar pyrophosphorylase family protein